MSKAVVLFSGGLDSLLAIRILQEQGLEVEALNVRTPFDCCKVPAAHMAGDLDVRLTVLPVADDYLDIIRRPRWGYGKAVNPCIDCRVYLCQMGKRFMEEVGACVVATGEVAGQRPNSQKQYQLGRIARASGLDGRLLRPLSAKLLEPTIPEMEGIVDRERLFGHFGRSRKPLIALAQQLGIQKIPQPSVGCPLTEVTFEPRVRDLLKFLPYAERWDFEILNHGRHLRLDERTKIVVGRNQPENGLLESFFRQPHALETVLLVPEDFPGPAVLLIGEVNEPNIEAAASALLRFAQHYDAEHVHVRLFRDGGCGELIPAKESAEIAALELL